MKRLPLDRFESGEIKHYDADVFVASLEGMLVGLSLAESMHVDGLDKQTATAQALEERNERGISWDPSRLTATYFREGLAMGFDDYTSSQKVEERVDHV